jgi:L-cysteine:1D-myo-inositol 2-amino-2-deoxy-alpha-D-glucopyranoside ligase
LTGKELAATYVHAGMIGLDGEKMSKSKGNLIFVSRLVAAGVDPMAIRWALMSDHYRTDRMWGDDLLLLSQKEIGQLQTALNKNVVAPTTDLIQEIIQALSNDLDTPAVVKALNSWSLLTMEGSEGGDASELRQALDALLGLLL